MALPAQTIFSGRAVTHGNTQAVRDSFGIYVTFVEACTNAATHTELIDQAKAPTCTETGLTEGSHCSVLGKDFEDENGTKEMTDTSIPTVEHEWSDWKVTTPAISEADGEETRPLAHTKGKEDRMQKHLLQCTLSGTIMQCISR